MTTQNFKEACTFVSRQWEFTKWSTSLWKSIMVQWKCNCALCDMCLPMRCIPLMAIKKASTACTGSLQGEGVVEVGLGGGKREQPWPSLSLDWLTRCPLKSGPDLPPGLFARSTFHKEDSAAETELNSTYSQRRAIYVASLYLHLPGLPHQTGNQFNQFEYARHCKISISGGTNCFQHY